MREVYTGNRKDTEGLVILFTWYMLDGLLNLILEASSQGFVRRAELGVSEMLVKIGWGEKGKLDRRTEESLGKEEYGSKSDRISVRFGGVSEGCWAQWDYMIKHLAQPLVHSKSPLNGTLKIKAASSGVLVKV